MKFNWGWGLAVFITIFLIAILSFVYFASTQQVNLVEKDYYPKGITYEQQIDKQRNAKQLEGKINVRQEAEQLFVQFPAGSFSEKTEGSLHFAHIEDYKLDQEMPLKLDTLGQQLIDASTFRKGRYRVKADWSTDETSYFQETTFTIQ